MRRLLFVAVAIAILVGDQFSKIWAGRLPLYQPVPVLPPIVYWYHTTNNGVAWSLFRNHTAIFSALAAAFCIGILIFGRSAINRSNFLAVAMGMLLGGAMGNLLDRVRFHHVVDFIDVHIGTWYQWPTFNVADSAITSGMVLLAGYFWFAESKTQPVRSADQDTITTIESPEEPASVNK